MGARRHFLPLLIIAAALCLAPSAGAVIHQCRE